MQKYENRKLLNNTFDEAQIISELLQEIEASMAKSIRFNEMIQNEHTG